MATYSIWSVLRNGLTGNKGWKPTWRKAEPKRSYDVIVVGGGKTRHAILDAFEARLGNDREREFRTALEQIDRIALLRLEAMAK